MINTNNTLSTPELEQISLIRGMGSKSTESRTASNKAPAIPPQQIYPGEKNSRVPSCIGSELLPARGNREAAAAASDDPCTVKYDFSRILRIPSAQVRDRARDQSRTALARSLSLFALSTLFPGASESAARVQPLISPQAPWPVSLQRALGFSLFFRSRYIAALSLSLVIRGRARASYIYIRARSVRVPSQKGSRSPR